MSIENLCSDEVKLPTDEAVVSIEILRSEVVELPDASVEASDTIESWRDTESLSPSSVEQTWRRSGCWLQTARNVSLFLKVNLQSTWKRGLRTHALMPRNFAASHSAPSCDREAF